MPSYEEDLSEFERRNTQVLGISTDNVHSNDAWAKSMGGLSYPLLSDFFPHGHAALSYGVIKGFGRWFFRFGAGWYEFATFPFPTYKGSYRPFYRPNIPWIHGGWEEFPPLATAVPRSIAFERSHDGGHCSRNDVACRRSRREVCSMGGAGVSIG